MAVRQQDLDAAHGDCRAAKAYEAFRHSDGAAKSDHVWNFLLSIADSQSLSGTLEPSQLRGEQMEYPFQGRIR
jgi:hypothetical protein